MKVYKAIITGRAGFPLEKFFFFYTNLLGEDYYHSTIEKWAENESGFGDFDIEWYEVPVNTLEYYHVLKSEKEKIKDKIKSLDVELHTIELTINHLEGC